MDPWQLVGYVGSPIGAAVVAWFVGRAGALSSFKKTVTGLEGSFLSLKQGLQLHTEAHAQVVKNRFDDVERRMEELHNDIERVRDQSGNWAKDEELNNFMQEVNRKWQEIHTLLGEIKGHLSSRRMSPYPSSERK